MFTGRTDAEAEILICWPPDSKHWLIGKDPDAGKDWKAGGEGDNRGWDGCLLLLGLGGDDYPGFPHGPVRGKRAYSCWGLGEAALWDPPLPSQRQKQLISTNVLWVVIRKEFKTGPSYRRWHQEITWTHAWKESTWKEVNFAKYEKCKSKPQEGIASQHSVGPLSETWQTPTDGEGMEKRGLRLAIAIGKRNYEGLTKKVRMTLEYSLIPYTKWAPNHKYLKVRRASMKVLRKT